MRLDIRQVERNTFLACVERRELNSLAQLARTRVQSQFLSKYHDRRSCQNLKGIPSDHPDDISLPETYRQRTDANVCTTATDHE
jgi:hypothetical protein